jgi:hypothetical protein
MPALPAAGPPSTRTRAIYPSTCAGKKSTARRRLRRCLGDASAWVVEPDLAELALRAVKQALWPNQQLAASSTTNQNPGPPAPNPMSGVGTPQAQPLVPPEQPTGGAAASAPQNPSPQSAPEPSSPLFAVPHPPSDAMRWQQMVQAPFLANAPPAPDAQAPAAATKTARAELFLALRRGRWSWLEKRGQRPGVPWRWMFCCASAHRIHIQGIIVSTRRAAPSWLSARRWTRQSTPRRVGVMPAMRLGNRYGSRLARRRHRYGRKLPWSRAADNEPGSLLKSGSARNGILVIDYEPESAASPAAAPAIKRSSSFSFSVASCRRRSSCRSRARQSINSV